MSITAKDVKTLRERTGAGMMDCKKALGEAEGDMDKAVEILRKRGQKVADKRADRDANQGVIVTKLSPDGKVAAAVELNCETDFVARNEDFIKSATSFVEAVFASKTESVEALKSESVDGLSIRERLQDMVGSIGEKIDVSKVVYFESTGQIVEYIHPGNQLVTFVEFAGSLKDEEVGKDVAMQVAAMRPIATTKDEVSQSQLDKELEIAKEQLINEGKTAEIAEKAARGKLRRFFEENVLVEQKFVKDGSLSVGQYVKSKGAPEVKSFIRIQLGEQ